MQQVHNYGRMAARIGDNAVLAFHCDYLETIALELQLMVAQGREALDAARTAVEMAQVQISHVQARRQQEIEVLLAVLGVAFAVPAIIDRDAAGEVISLVCCLAPFCGPAPDGGYNFWWLLLVQVMIVVVVGVIAAKTVRRYGIWRRRRTGAPGQ